MLFLYEWESKHNALAASRSINAAFGTCSVNERTIQRWNAKFETGDESLTNEDRSKLNTVAENEVLRAIVEKKSKLYC